MNNTQNEKKMQIHSSMLVVGVDIAKKIHYARAFDDRGIELGKVCKFTNSRDGFQKFSIWMETLQAKHKKDDIVVGFEPTGHYWWNLGDYLKACAVKLAILNPFHVKCSRELDDNSPSKTDHKDPMTIAMLVTQGRYRDVYLAEGVYQELREGVSERERLVEDLVRLNNRVIRWLDVYFPEFTLVFKSWKGKTARLLLELYSTPSSLVAAGTDVILDTLRQHLKRSPSRKTIERLVEVAKTSIGRQHGMKQAVQSLQHLLTSYSLLESQKQDVEDMMIDLLQEIPAAEHIMAIQGVGPISTAIILSEIGDIERFDDPRQIIKYAGLSLRYNTSGKHKGKTTISKRGRRLLRHAVFRTVVSMLATNPEFRFLHAINQKREVNPLNKMQSITALSGKFLRILYAMMTKDLPYDPQQVVHPKGVAA